MRARARAYTITYSRLVVRTSSHSLFVRVRTRCSYEFARCSYEFAYAVRALFVRCSYERELTRELRDAPLCVYSNVPSAQLVEPGKKKKNRRSHRRWRVEEALAERRLV